MWHVHILGMSLLPYTQRCHISLCIGIETQGGNLSSQLLHSKADTSQLEWRVDYSGCYCFYTCYYMWYVQRVYVCECVRACAWLVGYGCEIPSHSHRLNHHWSLWKKIHVDICGFSTSGPFLQNVSLKQYYVLRNSLLIDLQESEIT